MHDILIEHRQYVQLGFFFGGGGCRCCILLSFGKISHYMICFALSDIKVLAPLALCVLDQRITRKTVIEVNVCSWLTFNNVSLGCLLRDEHAARLTPPTLSDDLPWTTLCLALSHTPRGGMRRKTQSPLCISVILNSTWTCYLMERSSSCASSATPPDRKDSARGLLTGSEDHRVVTDAWKI